MIASFIAGGGDNFQVFVKHSIKRHPGNVAATMVAEYIKSESPIITGEEDRIMFVTSTPKPKSAASNISGTLTVLVMVTSLFFQVFFEELS